MPARANKLNWNLLLEPSMAGLATEANANARMHASIQGSLSSLVDDVQTNRREKESKRRYDTTEARIRESSIDLKREMAQAKIDALKAKQAGVSSDFDSTLQGLRDTTGDSERSAQGDFEARAQALHDSVLAVDPNNPKTISDFKALVDSFGGPDIASKIIGIDLTAPRPGLNVQSKADRSVRDPFAQSPAAGEMTPQQPQPQPTAQALPAQAMPSVPQPTIGPLGAVDRPSYETLGEAAMLEEKHKQIIENQKALRMKSRSPLLSDAQRQAADLAYKQADSRRILLEGQVANLKSQGQGAAKRESMRDEIEKQTAVAAAGRGATKKAAEEKQYSDRTNEMEQFRSLAPTRFPDLTQQEMEGAAGSLASGMTAESVFAQLGQHRTEVRQAGKDAESLALRKRYDARAQARFDDFTKSIPVREAAAKAALDRKDMAAYEPYVRDAEGDLRRMESRLKEAQDGGDESKIAAATEARDVAEAHLYRMRGMRPGAGETLSDVRTEGMDRVGAATGMGKGGAEAGAVPDFATIDAAVRQEMAGKPEKEIRAEVLRRLKGG